MFGYYLIGVVLALTALAGFFLIVLPRVKRKSNENVHSKPAETIRLPDAVRKANAHLKAIREGRLIFVEIYVVQGGRRAIHNCTKLSVDEVSAYIKQKELPGTRREELLVTTGFRANRTMTWSQLKKHLQRQLKVYERVNITIILSRDWQLEIKLYC